MFLSTWPKRARESLAFAFGLVVFLELIKDLAKVLPSPGPTILYTLAAAVQLYLPLWWVGREGLDARAVGLDESRWRTDVKWALLFALVTFGPYAVGHHLWWTEVFQRQFHPALPEHLPNLVLTHFLGVALPEEVFYRGFVQPRLAERFTKRITVFGASLGWEIPIASAIFALGHFAGEYDPTRLGPFFPGLLFGFLRAKTGTVYGAVTYHALSNILSECLYACYR